METKKQKDGQDKELREFMRKDYELRISYLNNHFSRMWMRFNYFVAIESALVGGKFLLDANQLSTELTVAGIVLTIGWYVMGAEDRFLVRVYRKQVENAGKQAANATGSGSDFAKTYLYVGSIDKDVENSLREADKKKVKVWLWELFTGWRWDPISTTHLASLLPLLVLVLWVYLFFFPPQKESNPEVSKSIQTQIVK